MFAVAIVLIFLVCHAYRVALKVYEFAHPNNQTQGHFEYCDSMQRLSVPFFFVMLLTTSDIFLVFNSSVNFVVYCCVGEEFRHEVWRLFLPRRRG